MTRLLLILTLCAAPAMAAAFERVTDRDAFIDLVKGHDLTRFGIRLTVTVPGGIDGRAFGRRVTGSWQWQDGYFCREMAYGSTAIPANCQLVQTDGQTVRFTADRGAGDTADLRLD